MKIFSCIFIALFSSNLAFGTIEERIEENYHNLLNDHYIWYQKHKHCDVDWEYWFNLGKISAYDEVRKILIEESSQKCIQ